MVTVFAAIVRVKGHGVSKVIDSWVVFFMLWNSSNNQVGKRGGIQGKPFFMVCNLDLDAVILSDGFCWRVMAIGYNHGSRGSISHDGQSEH